jgi:hypothetical protein
LAAFKKFSSQQYARRTNQGNELVNCYAQGQRAFQACTQMQNQHFFPQQLVKNTMLKQFQFTFYCVEL